MPSSGWLETPAASIRAVPILEASGQLAGAVVNCGVPGATPPRVATLSERGGGGGSVAVRARRRGRVVEVRVQDEGIGISERDQRNLFRKFFRVDASQRGGIRGVGLGLFLVRGFVAAMGGRIWVESELGKGSTFVVELPACEEAPSATAASSERVA